MSDKIWNLWLFLDTSSDDKLQIKTEAGFI